MSKEKWVEDINNTIDLYASCDIETIRKLAERNDVEVYYALEKYRDLIVYKINKMVKE